MTSHRAIVKELLGVTIAVVLTAGMISGVAFELQQSFQPVYDAQKESSLRQEREAAARRATGDQQVAAAKKGPARRALNPEG